MRTLLEDVRLEIAGYGAGDLSPQFWWTGEVEHRTYEQSRTLDRLADESLLALYVLIDHERDVPLEWIFDLIDDRMRVGDVLRSSDHQGCVTSLVVEELESIESRILLQMSFEGAGVAEGSLP